MRRFLPSLSLSGSSIAGSTAAPRGPGLELAAGRQGEPCPEEPALGSQGKRGVLSGSQRAPTELWGSGSECHLPSVTEDLEMKPEWTKHSCITGLLLPFIFRPTSSLRSHRPTRADFRGGILLISHLPSRQGRGKVSQFGLGGLPPYLVKPEALMGNTFTPSLPVPHPGPLSLHHVPSSSACSALPCVFATALRQPQDLQGQVSTEKNCEQLSPVKEIAILSLNHTFYYRVELIPSKAFFFFLV